MSHHRSRKMEPGLNNLSPVNRLWFTLFLITVLIGLAAAFSQHVVITGMNPEKTAAYFRGGEFGDAIQVEKPLQDMFRVTHTHLIGTGLLIFVLCRIFSMAPVSDRIKMLTLLSAYGSLWFQVGAPWLVRFGSAALSPLVGVSATALTAMILIMTLSSLYFMWLTPSSPPQSPPSE